VLFGGFHSGGVVERLYLALGVILLLVAFGLGLYSYSWVPTGATPTYSLSGATGGCAVAAGLCFVASALASRGRRGPN
jgi:hypothetical protein